MATNDPFSRYYAKSELRLQVADGVEILAKGTPYRMPAFRYGEVWLAWAYGPKDIRLGMDVELQTGSLHFKGSGHYLRLLTNREGPTVFIVRKLTPRQSHAVQKEAESMGWKVTKRAVK